MIESPTKYQIDILAEIRKGTRNVVIDAKAGCGKSTTAIRGILPVIPGTEKVLLACFGSRIQEEAVEKVAQTNGISCDLDVLTFHSLGNRAIRKVWGNVRLNNFREQNIAEKLGRFSRENHRSTICAIGGIAQKAKEVAPFATREDLEDIAERFDLYTNACQKEGFDLEDVLDWAEKVLKESKKKDGTISFADMIWLPLVLGFAKPTYDTIIIDECQDLNLSQILLAQKFLKIGGRTIIIGDPRQAIFAFRGADSKSIERLKFELPGAVELPLPETFRCGKAIVRLAQDIVPGFIAHESNEEGSITEVNLEEMLNQAKPGDAILSRKNAPLTSTCLKLWRKRVKAHIEGKDLGKNLCTMADVVTNKRPMKLAPFLEKLHAFASEQETRIGKKRNADQLIADLWDKVECMEVLSEGLDSVTELQARIKELFQDGDKVGRRGKVILSSIHRAKGLEFDRVFGLAWTLMDHSEEEENLRYVLITRAKQELTWVHKD